MDPIMAQQTSSGAQSLALLHLEAAERLAAAAAGTEGIAPRAVNRVAVIGAGTMGSGIGVSLADAGILVDCSNKMPLPRQQVRRVCKVSTQLG
jgi:hypothetical protein